MSRAFTVSATPWRSASFVPTATAILGLLALVTGIAWWWLIYSQVVGNHYIDYTQAAPCLIGTSDLCNLAQALCKGEHFLGIKRYSPTLFWVGAAFAMLGFAAAIPRRGR